MRILDNLLIKYQHADRTEASSFLKEVVLFFHGSMAPNGLSVLKHSNTTRSTCTPLPVVHRSLVPTMEYSSPDLSHVQGLVI